MERSISARPNIPNMVAIIRDGNGRGPNKKGKIPLLSGTSGVDAGKAIRVRLRIKNDIPVLTLFCL